RVESRRRNCVVRKRLSRKRVDDRAREPPLLFVRRGDDSCQREELPGSFTSIREEEPRFIAAVVEMGYHDRPPDYSTELVAFEFRARSLVEEVARVEVVVPVELVECSVKRVRAALRDHAELPARPQTEFRSVESGLDLELLHRVRTDQ